MTLQITILGCGSSGGVPRVGGDWGVCDPNQPKNRRTRCSILVEQWQGTVEPLDAEKTIILVDTSPDLREQLIGTKTRHLDALLYTHDHADQTHGIDDVRALTYIQRSQIPTYMDAYTKEHVFERFKYCFEMPEGRVHPPILDIMPLIKDDDEIIISGPGGDVAVGVLGLSHGPTPSFGFVFNHQAAYTPDVWDISPKVLRRLQGINLWVLDALRYNAHPTHAHADKALSWVAQTQTKIAVMTNLHIDMDYEILSHELPGSHLVAYDGLKIVV